MQAARLASRAAAASSFALLAVAGCTDLLYTGPPVQLTVRAPDLRRPLEDFFPREDRPKDPIGRALFDEINRNRRDAGLAPVQWDERAARLARQFSESQLEDKTFGHFLTEGTPPYARDSAAGILGASTENTAAVSTDGVRFTLGPVGLALEGHRRMLEEQPPEDGHRRAILDPDATHVGVGAAISGREFRLDEEFVSRRFEWLRVTRAGEGGASVRVKGRAFSDASLEFVTAAREPLPVRLSRDEVAKRRSYSYPEPRGGLLPGGGARSFSSLATSHSVVLSTRGRFSFAYRMEEPGLWTFVLYFRRSGERSPVPGASFSLWVGPEASDSAS